MIKKLTKIGLVVLSTIMCMSVFAACGGGEFDENKAIVVVSREDGSGSRDAFMELVFGKDFKEIVLPATHVVHTSYSAVFNKIKTDPQAIAYDSFGYVTDEVKMLKINGVECSDENISSGAYKLMRPFSVVYQVANITGDNATSANAKFLEFLTSSNSQTMIAADGLTGDSTRDTAYVVQDGLTGTVKVSGGTTVKLLVDKLAEEFMRLQPDVTVQVAGGGSGHGRNEVRDGVVHFGMVGAAVTEAHMTDMSKNGEQEIGVTKLCDDGIAVTVNKSNPITNITIEQLQSIYNGNATTKYSSWADLFAAQA